jgi:hypothetical protein
LSATALSFIPVISLNAAGVVSSARILTPISAVSLNAAGVVASSQALILTPRVLLSVAQVAATAVSLSPQGGRASGSTYVVLNGAELPIVFKAAKGGVLVDSSWGAVHS